MVNEPVTCMILPFMTTLSCHLSVKQKSKSGLIAKSTKGFSLIESVAALACLAVFTLLLISAWHTGWDTGDDKEQARALKLLELAEEKAQQPQSNAPAPMHAKPDSANTPD